MAREKMKLIIDGVASCGVETAVISEGGWTPICHAMVTMAAMAETPIAATASLPPDRIACRETLAPRKSTTPTTMRNIQTGPVVRAVTRTRPDARARHHAHS